MKGGMQQLMKQANQLQLKIKKMQEELATREYEASAGGEAVKVRVISDQKMSAIVISEDLMKSGDVEMLQDLIMTATNEALRKAKETQATEMEKVTGGFNFPGM